MNIAIPTIPPLFSTTPPCLPSPPRCSSRSFPLARTFFSHFRRCFSAFFSLHCSASSGAVDPDAIDSGADSQDACLCDALLACEVLVRGVPGGCSAGGGGGDATSSGAEGKDGWRCEVVLVLVRGVSVCGVPGGCSGGEVTCCRCRCRCSCGRGCIWGRGCGWGLQPGVEARG